MRQTKLKIMDLFCGTGGFSKGLENSGHFEVIFGLDVLPVAVDTFKQNHPLASAVATDIRSLPPEEVERSFGIRRGDVDLIVGGPPCQGFSSIRPHRSRDREDPRNSLFTDFAEYVRFFRPRHFVIENVVGLASYQGGATIEAMEETFCDSGYTTDWKILNSAQYGVPQKRERLIMLGTEVGAPLSFPLPTHGGGKGTTRTIGVRDKGRMHGAAQSSLVDDGLKPELIPVITVVDAIDDLPVIQSGERSTEYDKPPRTSYQADRRCGIHQLALHESTRHTDRMLEIIKHSGPNISSIPRHLISSGFSSCYSRLAADEPSVTITVNFVHPASNRCIHPTLDRALTPREGARLQSFDDDFRFAGTRAQIVRQIGNAVPPLLGQALGNHLSEELHEGSAQPVAVGA